MAELVAGMTAYHWVFILLTACAISFLAGIGLIIRVLQCRQCKGKGGINLSPKSDVWCVCNRCNGSGWAQ